MIDFLFSGVLVRYPNLKLMYAESQIGWIPYYLERADDNYRTHRWAQGEERLPEPPSYYYHRQIYSCFFKDSAGMKLLDEVGVDNVLFETDYPHSDGTFPRSREVAHELFGHLPDDVMHKLARGNAIKLFDLDLSS
jgi:predicted TIM-barrel fold metal-dependent hydrolase